jgi:hypothetical protein
MKKKIIKTWLIIPALLAGMAMANAQGKYFTRNGNVSFSAGTSLENIDAINRKAASVIDAATGQLEFTVLIKAFEFERALMQDHFNENYMESDKFPKASFKGSIVNNNEVGYTKNGSYPVQLKGDLTIHGVTKPVTLKGNIEVKDQKLNATSAFDVTIADYNITIPGLVSDKIDKQAKVKVDLVYEPLNN